MNAGTYKIHSWVYSKEGEICSVCGVLRRDWPDMELCPRPHGAAPQIVVQEQTAEVRGYNLRDEDR